MENENNFPLIKQALQNADHDVSITIDTKETLQIGKTALDMVVLEPSMSRWEWLGVLINIKREHADVPVILYSPDINIPFFSISEETSTFIVNDLRILKDKLGDIVRAKEKVRKIKIYHQLILLIHLIQR